MAGPWAKRGIALFRAKAEELAKDPKAAGKLLDEAVAKAGNSKAVLKEVKEQLQALMRLLKATITGEYKGVPWTSLVTGLAAILYFVNPFDLVPDFLVGVGLLDDVTVIAFALNVLKSDLAAFKKWEDERRG
jgi:uncharacterized membrane protein YkvA (DUF1232 family)